MRLIRLTTNYFSYLQQFYSQHPELKQESYSRQYQILSADCFGWADFWTHALCPLGYEVWEPIGNAEVMQKTWAQEKRIRFNEENWLLDIVAAQVKDFQPDIIFVDDYNTFPADFLKQLRYECSSIHLFLGWCGAPYSDDSFFHACDLVLSNIPGLVNLFRANGHQSEHLCHAFEPRILNHLDTSSQQTTNFSFIGSIAKGSNAHHQREQLLKYLSETTDLQIWADISQPSPQELKKLPVKQFTYDLLQVVKRIPGSQSVLTNLPKLKTYATLDHRPDLSSYVDATLTSRSHAALYGLSMFRQLYASKVTLNTHIDLSGQFASNMRLYEATGVGACLLTDWKPNLHELFEPDIEVVTYQSPEECVEKVNWLLDHPAQRQAIAHAGQSRTLREHTFAHRAVQLDEIIQANMQLRSRD